MQFPRLQNVPDDEILHKNEKNEEKKKQTNPKKETIIIEHFSMIYEIC